MAIHHESVACVLHTLNLCARLCCGGTVCRVTGETPGSACWVRAARRHLRTPATASLWERTGAELEITTVREGTAPTERPNTTEKATTTEGSLWQRWAQASKNPCISQATAQPGCLGGERSSRHTETTGQDIRTQLSWRPYLSTEELQRLASCALDERD